MNLITHKPRKSFNGFSKNISELEKLNAIAQSCFKQLTVKPHYLEVNFIS